jgi:hypothetical protein
MVLLTGASASPLAFQFCPLCWLVNFSESEQNETARGWRGSQGGDVMTAYHGIYR